MGWETRRNGKKYFYISKRGPDGKVRKIYLGSGPVAERIVWEILQEREQRGLAREELKQQAKIERQITLEFNDILNLVGEFLVSIGLHQPKSRGWRRKRTPGTDQIDQTDPQD